jgi:hypothetical protein
MNHFFYFWLALLGVLPILPLCAQSGDSVVVQTFTFDDPSPVGFSAPYRGTFAFPEAGESFSRILMSYTLKCDSRTNQDGFPCGEWDYLTYTFVYDSTGRWDSTYRTHPNYKLGNATPDSLALSYLAAYDRRIDAQPVARVYDTLSTLTASIGAGSLVSPDLLGGQAPRRRAQFLWTADELTAAGLRNQPLTALHLNLDQLGSDLRHLRVGLKQVAGKDSLDASSYEAAGFQVVYRRDSAWTSPGWQPMVFHQPFLLDTTQALVVEISYENADAGTEALLRADATSLPRGAYTQGDDHYFSFEGRGSLLPSALALADSLDQEITVSFWHWGDPAALPANTTAFEALDDQGNRVLNAHVPWGDGTVYWDAGNDGGAQFDRIDRQATPADYEGAWHHWAFTKDALTGTMQIFLDGVLWRGRFSRHRSMAGVVRWAIGANANDGNHFWGRLDAFRVWNRALDAATIQAWMYREVDISHPLYPHLIADYSFDQLTADWKTPDQSAQGGMATLQRNPRWLGHAPTTLFRNWQTASLRPQVIFDQSEYLFTLDTLIVIDSLPLAPVEVVIFGHDPQGLTIAEDAPNHPRIPTDTLIGWRADASQQTLDYLTGQLIDTQPFSVDTVLRRQDNQYYSPVVRYEIGRYITPYGINLDLGAEGTTWMFDVTDYAPLLQGNVYLQAGNNQELLDLKFIMIKGEAPRPVHSIRNIWDGSFSYQSLVDDNQGAPRSFLLDPHASSFAVKTRSSGHGFGGPTNCAEFCPRQHQLLVNGTLAFDWELWNECASNFVYPQGGTWVYDRAGWCPGDVVNTYQHELGDLVQAGDSITLDYHVPLPNFTSPEGNYVMRAQLFEYGPHSHVLDARLDEILAPSQADRHSRYNPICDHPRISVSNQGKDSIYSMLIRYGVEGSASVCTYEWTGNLPFGESVVIDLPRGNWSGLDPAAPVFFADVVYVNEQGDEVPNNDLLRSPFDLVPQYQEGLVLEFRTNNAPQENRYEIRDRDGQLMVSVGSFGAGRIYRDTLDLPPGCYTFQFFDTGEDGIAWWANNDGNGYVRLLDSTGSVILTFEPDYGRDIVHQFTMGYQLGEEAPDVVCTDTSTNTVYIASPASELQLSVYPNPAQDRFSVEVSLPQREQLTLRLFNAAGQLLRTEQHRAFRQGVLPMEAPDVAGLYFVQVQAGSLSRVMPIRIE